MGDELLKITFNAFADDVAELKRRFGYGWSEGLRLIIRQHVNELRRREAEPNLAAEMFAQPNPILEAEDGQ